MPAYTGTMSEVPQYAETVVQSLSSIELFEFSAEARQEIDLFYSQIDIPAHAREQSRALSLLHAAEYALLPAFANPGEVELPPDADAIMVSADDARLALLKGDCSLIIWTHTRTGDRIEQLQPSDLMVFSGDVSKARSLGRWNYNATVYNNELQEYTSDLDSFHQQSSWEPAVRVAASGAILLQGLLWNLKLAVVESTTDEEFLDALHHYLSGLEQRRAQGQAQETPLQEAEPQEAEQSAAPLIAQLNQLAQLHSQGVLTDDEFAAAKTKVLGPDR